MFTRDFIKSNWLTILLGLLLVGLIAYQLLDEGEEATKYKVDKLEEELERSRQIVANLEKAKFADSIRLSAMRELMVQDNDSLIIIRKTFHETVNIIDNYSDDALIRFYAEYKYTPFRP